MPLGEFAHTSMYCLNINMHKLQLFRLSASCKTIWWCASPILSLFIMLDDLGCPIANKSAREKPVERATSKLVWLDC